MITLDELPLAARNRFPDLDFSSHIYAEDPTMRAIVVNGTQLSAGSSYGSVVLKEITEEGVVFLFEKYLVSINVLESWQ